MRLTSREGTKSMSLRSGKHSKNLVDRGAHEKTPRQRQAHGAGHICGARTARYMCIHILESPHGSCTIDPSAVSVATLPFCHCPRVTNQTTPVASTTKRFLRRGLSVCSDHVARPYYLCSASQSRPRMIRLSVQAAAKKSLTLRRPVRNNQAIKQGWWAALPPACSYPAQQLFCDGRAFPNIFPNIYCNHPSTMTL
jgi:hypothetical protein